MAEIALIALILPWVVYLSVKLGTYAFFRGKQLFEENRDGKR